VQGQSNSGNGEGIELTDAWWAECAKRFLHPVQIEIIEVFSRSDEPLTVRGLIEVEPFNGMDTANLDHHVGRLRQLGALEVVGGQSGRGFMDVRYRLVLEKPHGR